MDDSKIRLSLSKKDMDDVCAYHRQRGLEMGLVVGAIAALILTLLIMIVV